MVKYKFLVTGGAGFIGSNMTDYLIELGYDVTIIDNLSTGKLSNINPKAKFHNIDLSTEPIKSLLEDIDYVIHMAAIPNVQQSIDNPIYTNKNNFDSTLNLINSCRNTKVKKIIFSSTCAIYGDTNVFPTNEMVTVNPMSPYSLQKLISEQYLKLYSDLYGIKSVCLRYFNVFGEHMSNEGAYKSVISIFLKQKSEGKNLTITNDGNQKRDFIYVRDIVRANFMSCLSDTGDFNIYNVGYGQNISVNEIASYFNQPTTYIGNRIEPFQSLCDNKKITQELGWSPTVTVEEWLKNKLNDEKKNII